MQRRRRETFEVGSFGWRSFQRVLLGWEPQRIEGVECSAVEPRELQLRMELRDGSGGGENKQRASEHSSQAMGAVLESGGMDGWEESGRQRVEA
jgi:hypothetical protein